ncbi:MAG: hypothetical protein ACJAT1_002310 [Marivirga sp.]|jgi:uncharacterized protein YyaL (SSP411 family)
MPNSNKLKDESSPYLQQHANNPVHWQAWNEAALAESIIQDKPIILSIGYAACHWCHVMEHESFEDEEVARLMNENFICIKVDREERPDVDQVYMDAVQAMGLNGGWPLNVFLMPDQKPFYGGTYFPKNNWLEMLDKVAIAFQTNRDKLAESSNNFAKALQVKSSKRLNFELSDTFHFNQEVLHHAFEKLMTFIDWDNGGTLGAPKFPMPVIWSFLYHYYKNNKDPESLKALNLCLTEMAKGGIYDQVGGGFSRYSVDNEWFAPHFEKMLYDNGQLISLYAKAATIDHNPLYVQVVSQSIEFIQRELENGDGGIFSALDADSEGIEGKYYTWTSDEWNETLKDDAQLMAHYYSLTATGNWEEGRNILFKNSSIKAFAIAQKLEESQTIKIIERANNLLLKARETRIRPTTDDKILCGWNALYLNALCDAYKIDANSYYLELATKSYDFIAANLLKGNQLFRNYKNGKATIPAYLEDYALTIKAFIAFSEISSDEKVLNTASTLCSYVVTNFFDDEEKLFYFTDDNAEALIARKKELFDNVIPSSNAIMAENLHWLALLTQNNDWSVLSNQMVHQLKNVMENEPRFMAQWLSMFSLKAHGSYEIVITGPDAASFQKLFWKEGIHNSIVYCNPEQTENALFIGKLAIEGKTTIYVCQNGACKQPLFSVHEALTAIN